jgi:uncharacterized RDD family membrane protein YckC
MINTSVRKEFEAKINHVKIIKPQNNINERRESGPMPKYIKKIKLNPPPKSIITRPKKTSELISKKDTRPILVEFQTKQMQIPKWRLQLQNVVKQRKERSKRNLPLLSTDNKPTTASKDRFSKCSGTLAEDITEESTPDDIENAHLVNALKRIRASRNKYHITEGTKEKIESEMPLRRNKEYPFTIASRTVNPQPDVDTRKAPVKFPVETTGTSETNEVEKNIYYTNKLDSLFLQEKVSSSPKVQPIETDLRKVSEKELLEDEIEITGKVLPDEEKSEYIEEIDDVAPFSLRFNSGVFDLIIGAFFSLVLTSPFMLLSANWFAFTSFLGFLFIYMLVMFIYLTATIGYYGKTFGMHLFRIEMIDVDGENYPSLHQAAVSSSLYLLSMAFLGIGFLTSLFDEDARAAHDLASGTIIVREL